MDPRRCCHREDPRTGTNSFVRPDATLTSSAPDQCNHTTCSTHRLGTYYTSSTLLKSTTREESGVRSTVQTPHTSHSSRLTPHTPRGFSALQDLPPCAGGAGRDRTDDLRLAKPPLSQLSYSPLSRASLDLVGLVGFEPTTPALSRRCSNQLSYRPSISGANEALFLCLNNR